MGGRAEATCGCSTCVTSSAMVSTARWWEPAATPTPTPSVPRHQPRNVAEAYFALLAAAVRRMVRTVPLQRQQDDRRNHGVYDERLRGTDAPRVQHFVPDTESLAVRVEVVPQRPEVEIEDVPADPASGLGPNRRRIPDERPPVDAHRLFCRRCGLSHGMWFGALMRPGDGASWPDRHVIGVVPPWAVLDRDAGG